MQTYGITDVVEGQGESGDPTRLGPGDRIKDAQALYPQGHGDAWGHYLTALKQFYRLLQHERFVWSTGNEAVLLGDGQLSVRFSHEQRFASAAAEKARVGAAIVERTFHKLYHDDHHARLRSYTDDEPGRHWGVMDWGRRAGQGTYFEWVTANALLPSCCDAAGTGCEKNEGHVDRSSMLALAELPAQFAEIQSTLDSAAIGLNPLGLTRDVVPFGLNNDRFQTEKAGHFQQAFERALRALAEANRSFDAAALQSLTLRTQKKTVQELARAVRDKEFEYRNRLIGIFGRPYPDDVGPGCRYSRGYEGPDIDHALYVDDVGAELGMAFEPERLIRIKVPLRADVSTLFTSKDDFFTLGTPRDITTTWGSVTSAFSFDFARPDLSGDDFPPFDFDRKKIEKFREGAPKEVEYLLSPTIAGFVKPAQFRRPCPAYGEVQTARVTLLRDLGKLYQDVSNYSSLIADIKEKTKATRGRAGKNP